MLFFNLIKLGSLQHILPIVFATLGTYFLIKYSNKKLNKLQKETVFKVLGVIVFLGLISFHVFRLIEGDYSISTELPLYLCSFMALILPIFTFYRKYWMFEILLFWIIAGTTQAIITPDITNGFPSFDYFRYWVVHLGLVVTILYAVFVFKMKPKFKSLFKSYVALQLYLLFALVINYLLDANYMYLNAKPKSASILDVFGNWPYYIIVCQLIIIPYFLLIYLPFWLSRKKTNKS